MKSIQILGINGSIRPGSSSHVVMNEIGNQISTRVSFSIFSNLAEIPAFDGRDEDPKSVSDFKLQLKQADAVVLVTPEYAFGVPGALKNLLDWTVGSSDFVDKPVALITASSNGEKAHESMQYILGAISAKLLPETTLLISFIRAKVKEGKVSDSNTMQALHNAVEIFLKTLSNEK